MLAGRKAPAQLVPDVFEFRITLQWPLFSKVSNGIISLYGNPIRSYVNFG
jgi:hypothetical protein